jgi:hypothetical protein
MPCARNSTQAGAIEGISARSRSQHVTRPLSGCDADLIGSFPRGSSPGSHCNAPTGGGDQRPKLAAAPRQRAVWMDQGDQAGHSERGIRAPARASGLCACPLAFERKPPRIQVFTRCLKSWLAVAANSFPPKPKSGNALSNAAGNWPDWKRPERTALEVFITGERQGPRPRCNRLCLVTAGESGGEAEAPSFRKGRLHRSQSGAPYARRRLDPLHGLHTPRPAMPNRRLTNCSSRTRHKSDAISITPSAASSTYCPFCQYSQIVIERTSDPGL